MQITNIQELKEAIVSERFTNEQIQEVIYGTCGSFYVSANSRQQLADELEGFLKQYPKISERPLFLDIKEASDDDLDNRIDELLEKGGYSTIEEFKASNPR